MIELGRSTWLSLAGVVTLLAASLWFAGIIPWWGILIAVPVVTAAAAIALMILGVVMWMAGGSH